MIRCPKVMFFGLTAVINVMQEMYYLLSLQAVDLALGKNKLYHCCDN